MIDMIRSLFSSPSTEGKEPVPGAAKAPAQSASGPPSPSVAEVEQARAASPSIVRADVMIDRIIIDEGGDKFTNDPQDPGGATKYGITLDTLRDWRGVKTLPVSAVIALSLPEARAIYRTRYVASCRVDQMPIGIDYSVLDFAVNAGPSRSIKTLQKIIGVAPDGVVGPVTLKAVRDYDQSSLINNFAAARSKYYQSLSNFGRFGRGWLNRTERVRVTSLADLVG